MVYEDWILQTNKSAQHYAGFFPLVLLSHQNHISQFLAVRTAVNIVDNVHSINQVVVIFLDPFPSFSVYPVGGVAKTVFLQIGIINQR